jgi:hypothetical protein
MERFNISRNHLRFYNSVGMTAVYTVPKGTSSAAIRGDALKPLVHAALRGTMDTQPIMGVGIENEGELVPKWLQLDKVNLDAVVKFLPTSPNLEEWIQEEHQKPFERVEELPLWRIVASPLTAEGSDDNLSFALGFFYHHAIGDGLSGGAFHMTFLDALNAILAKGLPELKEVSVVTVRRQPLIPNVELVVPLSISAFFAIKEIFKAFVYSPFQPTDWTGPNIDEKTPRPPRSNCRIFSISAQNVNALVARCRQEQSSLTALIAVLIAHKLSLLHPTHSRFTANIPFSLRKFGGISDRAMGVFVSNIRPTFSSEDKPPSDAINCQSFPAVSELEGSAFWDSVRKCRKFIQDKTSSPADQNVGLLKFVKDFASFFRGKFGTQREHAFEVTNIGVVDGTSKASSRGGDGGASFNRIIFSSGLCTYADPYTFLLATARDGEMAVTVSWESGIVMDADALEVFNWLRDQLNDIATHAT